MTGLVGRMFREFALTLTIAVVVSAIVSLTLTPMMCSRLLRHQAANDQQAGRRASSTRAVDGDRRGLPPQPGMGAAPPDARRCWSRAGTLVATVWLYVVMPKGFLPPQDTGLIIAVSEAGPRCRSPRCSACRTRSRRRSSTDPDVDGRRVGGRRQPDQSDAERRPARHHAAPRDERRASVDDIVERLKRAVAPIPGMTRLFPAGAGHPDQHAGQPRAVPVHAGRHRRRRGARSGPNKLAEPHAAGSGGCATSPPRRRRAACACMVQVDRETAGRLGVSMQAVNDTLNDAFGQRQISTIYAQANQYRVILEAHAALSAGPGSLSKLYVAGANTSTGTTAVVQRASGTTNTDTSATPNAVTDSNRCRCRLSRASTMSAPLRSPSGAVSLGHHQLQSARAVRRSSDAVAAVARGAARRSACRRR